MANINHQPNENNCPSSADSVDDNTSVTIAKPSPSSADSVDDNTNITIAKPSPRDAVALDNAAGVESPPCKQASSRLIIKYSSSTKRKARERADQPFKKSRPTLQARLPAQSAVEEDVVEENAGGEAGEQTGGQDDPDEEDAGEDADGHQDTDFFGFHVADWLQYDPITGKVLTTWKPSWTSAAQRKYWGGGWKSDTAGSAATKGTGSKVDDYVNRELRTRGKGADKEFYVRWKPTWEPKANFIRSREVGDSFKAWLKSQTAGSRQA